MSAVAELDSARFVNSAPPEDVWTRDKNGANLVAFYEQELVAGVAPRKHLETAASRLAEGAPPDQVVARGGARVRYDGVVSITAHSGQPELEVEYARKRDDTSSMRIPVPDGMSPMDALAVVGQRLPRRLDLVEKRTNPFLHAARPFQLLLLFVLLGAGAHYFFTTDWDRWLKPDTQSGAKQAHAGRNGFQDSGYYGSPRVRVRGGAAKGLAVLFLAVVFVAAVLHFLGYAAVMTILGSAGGACLLWTLARLLRPPRSTSIVAVG